MASKSPFSASIKKPLLKWADTLAKQEKKNRSEIIEEALETLRAKKIGEEIKSSYLRMNTDEDALMMADMGLEDYMVNLPKT